MPNELRLIRTKCWSSECTNVWVVAGKWDARVQLTFSSAANQQQGNEIDKWDERRHSRTRIHAEGRRRPETSAGPACPRSAKLPASFKQRQHLWKRDKSGELLGSSSGRGNNRGICGANKDSRNKLKVHLFFLYIVSSMCTALYKEHNIWQFPAPKNLQLNIQQKEEVARV